MRGGVVSWARFLVGMALAEAGRVIAGEGPSRPEPEEREAPYEETDLVRLSHHVALTPRAKAMVDSGVAPPRHPRPDPHAPEPPLRGSAAAQRAGLR